MSPAIERLEAALKLYEFAVKELKAARDMAMQDEQAAASRTPAKGRE